MSLRMREGLTCGQSEGRALQPVWALRGLYAGLRGRTREDRERVRPQAGARVAGLLLEPC